MEDIKGFDNFLKNVDEISMLCLITQTTEVTGIQSCFQMASYKGDLAIYDS